MIVCKEKQKTFCTFVTLKMAVDFVMVKKYISPAYVYCNRVKRKNIKFRRVKKI